MEYNDLSIDGENERNLKLCKDIEFLCNEQSSSSFKNYVIRYLDGLYKKMYNELEKVNFDDKKLDEITDTGFITYILYRVSGLEDGELFDMLMNIFHLESLKKEELIFLHIMFKENLYYSESIEIIFLYFDSYGFNISLLYILLDNNTGINNLLEYLSNKDSFVSIVDEENDVFGDNSKKLFEYIQTLIQRCKDENLSNQIQGAIYKIAGDFFNFISNERDTDLALEYYGLSYLLGENVCLGEISEIYCEQGDYKKAVSYGNMGILNGIIKCYEIVMVSNLKMDNFSDAESILQLGISRGIENNVRLSIYYYTALYHYHKSNGNKTETENYYVILKNLLGKELMDMDETERNDIMNNEDYVDFFTPKKEHVKSIGEECNFKQLALFRNLSISSFNHNRLLFYFNKLSEIINLIMGVNNIKNEELLLETIYYILDNENNIDNDNQKLILNKITSFLSSRHITEKMNTHSRQKIVFEIVAVFLNHEYTVLVNNFDACIEFKESVKIIGLLLNTLGYSNKYIINSRLMSDTNISKSMDVSAEHGFDDIFSSNYYLNLINNKTLEVINAISNSEKYIEKKKVVCQSTLDININSIETEILIVLIVENLLKEKYDIVDRILEELLLSKLLKLGNYLYIELIGLILFERKNYLKAINFFSVLFLKYNTVFNGFYYYMSIYSAQKFNKNQLNKLESDFCEVQLRSIYEGLISIEVGSSGMYENINYQEECKILFLTLGAISKYFGYHDQSSYYFNEGSKYGDLLCLSISDKGNFEQYISKEKLLKLYKTKGSLKTLVQLLDLVNHEKEVFELLDISVRLSVEKSELYILNHLMKGGVNPGSKLFDSCKQLYEICVSKGYIGFIYNSKYRTLYLDYFNEIIAKSKQGLVDEYVIGLYNLVYKYHDLKSSILLLESLTTIKNQLISNTFNNTYNRLLLNIMNKEQNGSKSTDIFVTQSVIIDFLIRKIYEIKSIKLDVPDTHLMRSRELNTIGNLVGDNFPNSGLEIIYLD